MRLTGAMLFVRDLAAMTDFYRDVMGLTVDEATRTDRWVAFHARPEGGGMGAALSLHAIPPEIAATFEIATPAEAREDAACKLLFAVEDLAATLARLEAKGARIERRPWGGADVIDPEGNVIGLG